MKIIKVLVVDDSSFMRKIISDIINSDPELEVIETARNGKEAIEKITIHKPDVITMDVEMPVLDGLSALEEIMKNNPTPVIMLSTLTKEGADATMRALELGAVDFITKPSSIFKVNTEDMRLELIAQLKMASKVIMKKKFAKPIGEINKGKTETKKRDIEPKSRILKSGSKGRHKIIAIGTSTGGPKALQYVIPKLPADLNASVLIVQHMPPGFTKSLAERMDSMSQVKVKEAEDLDELEVGCVYIAPGNYHMRLKKENNKFIIRLGDDGAVTGHKPSVDAMMDSIAELKIDNVIGVIMTGMGSDGAKGLNNLKRNNNYVIAQDEETCVVFGMPGSTIKLGAVDKIVSLEEISNEIIKAMGV